MKVFISWSGEQSKHIALALREWLPRVIQAIVPYMSDEDNEAGTLWDEVLTTELDASNFGILCLTPSNVQSPWMHFEAGAISKTVTDYKARVVPLLYHLTPTDVRPPLSRFMSKPLNRRGILDTLASVNQLLPDNQRLKDADLSELFEIVWTTNLEERLETVPVGKDAQPRKPEDILEEVLGLVRSLDSRLSISGEALGAPNLGGKSLHAWLRQIAGPNGLVVSDSKGYVVRVPSLAHISRKDMSLFFALKDYLAATESLEIRLIEENAKIR